MDQNRPDAGDFRGLHGTQNGIAQESRADVPPLKSPIDRKPPEHHCRHGVRRVSLDTPRRVRMRYRANREGVITDNPLVYANHIRP